MTYGAIHYMSCLRDKWSTPDAPETEWMTFAKAQAALDDLRAAGSAQPPELKAIASFLDGWMARGR